MIGQALEAVAAIAALVLVAAAVTVIIQALVIRIGGVGRD